MFKNPSVDKIFQLLSKARTIAVVGLSPRTDRPSHEVASALQSFDYQIIPVRPGIDEILGETAYASLADVTQPIDIVDVFRGSQYVSEIIDQCIALKLPAVWLQDGVIDEQAALRAEAAGLTIIMDRCIYRDYLTFMAAGKEPLKTVNRLKK